MAVIMKHRLPYNQNQDSDLPYNQNQINLLREIFLNQSKNQNNEICSNCGLPKHVCACEIIQKEQSPQSQTQYKCSTCGMIFESGEEFGEHLAFYLNLKYKIKEIDDILNNISKSDSLYSHIKSNFKNLNITIK